MGALTSNGCPCSVAGVVPINPPRPTAEPVAFTRRNAIARGSLALIAASPVLRVMQTEVASAATRSGRWTFGAFASPANTTHVTADAMHKEVRQLERLVERLVEIVSSLVAWDEPFPTAVRPRGRS